MSRLYRRKSKNVEFKDAETSTYCNTLPCDKVLFANYTFSPSKRCWYPKEGYADKSTMTEESTSYEIDEESESEEPQIFKNHDASAVMEFTLDNKNIQELEHIFGDRNVEIQRGIKSVIKIPLILGEYLYKMFLKNTTSLQKTHSKSTPNLNEITKERMRNYSINEEIYNEYDELSVEALREIARQHDLDRLKHQEQANYYRSRKMAAAVKMCGERAKLSSQKSREYHERAAQKVLGENSKKQLDSKVIDLHRLRVREALQALNDFLNEQIEILNETDDKKEDTVRIVTGKGTNSKGGISKVKQAVINRLGQRKIELNLLNDGFIEAILRKSKYN